MPLEHSKSEKSFKKNLRTLLDEGYEQKQALAIAFDVKRKGKKKKRTLRDRDE